MRPMRQATIPRCDEPGSVVPDVSRAARCLVGFARRAHPPPPLGGRARGSAVAGGDAGAPARDPLAGTAGALADPRTGAVDDLPRPVPDLSVLRARGGAAHARGRAVRADLDAGAGLPPARLGGRVRRL